MYGSGNMDTGRMKLLVVIVLFTILFRSVYYCLLQGSHEGLYYLRLDNVREAVQYSTVGILLLFNKKKTGCGNTFIQFGATFCFSISVLMMYPFLPETIAGHAGIMLTSFYTIWSLIGIALVVYFIFCHRGGLL